jgi:DNA-binding PadR family transcriptional regulator
MTYVRLDYMAYIDILLLRHLFAGPAHGYELRKRVEGTVGIVLHNNSLYPALRRFEEAGAVTRTAEQQQGRPARHVYQLTDVGRELLHDMLAELPADQADDDTEFLTRIGQFGLLDPRERLAVLDARAAALHRRLERLRALQERAGQERWGTLVTGELIRRGEGELDWLTSLNEAAVGGVDRRRAGGSAGRR